MNSQVGSSMLVWSMANFDFTVVVASLSLLLETDPFSKELKAVSWGHSITCLNIRTVSGRTQFCSAPAVPGTPLPQPQPRHWCNQPGQDPPRIQGDFWSPRNGFLGQRLTRSSRWCQPVTSRQFSHDFSLVKESLWKAMPITHPWSLTPHAPCQCFPKLPETRVPERCWTPCYK